MLNALKKMFYLSIVCLMLVQTSTAAETKNDMACWNRYCEVDYQTQKDGQYEVEIETKRKYCFRPHYTCGYSVNSTERFKFDSMSDFIGNANITCAATTGTAPLPDIYCISSFLKDCRCGHRPFYGMDNDETDASFSDFENSDNLRGKAIEAFCDCQLSAVGNLILVCVLVPVILFVLTACFLKVFGGCLARLVSCGWNKIGYKQSSGTEENELVENANIGV